MLILFINKYKMDREKEIRDRINNFVEEIDSYKGPGRWTGDQTLVMRDRGSSSNSWIYGQMEQGPCLPVRGTLAYKQHGNEQTYNNI